MEHASAKQRKNNNNILHAAPSSAKPSAKPSNQQVMISLGSL
jgi:hypothetical protein